MRRQRNIFLIALGCSLALHVTGLEVYSGYTHHLQRSAEQARRRVAARQAKDSELIVRLDDFGDAKGAGIGSNSSPGEHPLQAREADVDQALLSRDPVGMSRIIQQQPSKWAGPTGEGQGGTPAAILPNPPIPAPDQMARQPVRPPAPHSPASTPPLAKPAMIPAPQVKVAEIPSEPTPELINSPTPPPVPPAVTIAQSPAVAAPSPSVQPPPRPATGDGRRPGMPVPSADALPESDSDSDPFSRISGTAIFHDGRLDVRLGRKVTTVRPQIGVAGQLDAMSINNPTLVLEVHIAATGKVADVKVVHSSGSNNLDEPTRLAVYDWRFEPARDAHGKAVSDVIYFAVAYR